MRGRSATDSRLDVSHIATLRSSLMLSIVNGSGETFASGASVRATDVK